MQSDQHFNNLKIDLSSYWSERPVSISTLRLCFPFFLYFVPEIQKLEFSSSDSKFNL